MTEAGMKRNFRFNYENIDEIVDILQPDLWNENLRGNSITPEQQVCIALHHYGSQPFQRSTGLFFDVSQNAALTAVKKESEALGFFKADWVKLSSYQVRNLNIYMYLIHIL